ncbi:MAG: transposase [Flavitalea sp.]
MQTQLSYPAVYISKNSQPKSGRDTASIKGWFTLPENDKYKDIIVNSLRFLVEDKRIKLYAFVIMADHIHLIWQLQPLIHPQHVAKGFFEIHSPADQARPV